jgi:GT2 family glycosyltransferase
MSIPVIGTAVVNNPYWVSRLLMSIDYPVDNFVIINNNGRGQIDEELNRLTNITHKYVKNIKVTHLPANIGVAGAWNLIIKSYLMSPYWIIVNDDVAFGAGFLEEMATAAESDPEVGIIHGNEGDYGVGSWDLFLIRDIIIKEFGLFDENLYPAYCEDADYIMRFAYRPIKKIMSLNSNYYHGHGNKNEYYKEGSQTEKSEPHLKEKLNISNDLNIEYLTKKWGPGWRMCNPENLPFKQKEHSISETTFDLEFVRKKYMGF